MAARTLGIILNGATGRICSTQHLANALAPIRREGGLPVGTDLVVPRLLLAGRDAAKLARVAAASDVADWTIDLDAALGDPDWPVFFDAAATHLRPATLRRAIDAGKHIYTEKPVAPTVAEGLDLLRAADARGLRHGAVEDKLYLPGFRKLKRLADDGFFGRVVGFRLEFGWWVFDGIEAPLQRPSWNYRRAGGGGIVSDMHPHWRYVVEGILGPIRRVVAANWTAQPERGDEAGERYAVDVEDSTATLLELASGACGTIYSTWATRVRGDDLVTFQVDGTKGSAMAGLRRCWVQVAGDTPRIGGFNLGADAATLDWRVDYAGQWREVTDEPAYVNPYRPGWEGFIRHVVAGAPFASDLAAGIRDVQLAEACLRSGAEGRWIETPPVGI
ncbi:MAG: Gfo/Idh/MocA family oxidoreductase [Alphaproteobacteria bacterium]|nr:Gfo/Idh/MocA family oxidoreductase [Alphaproteobacteria bacterium]